MTPTKHRVITFIVGSILATLSLLGCSGGGSDNKGADVGAGNSSGGVGEPVGQLQGVDGQLEIHATPFSIGVRWNVGESSDHDERFALSYFDENASAWLPSAPALHVEENTRHGTDRTAINQHYWASSLMNLEPDHRYQLRVVLTSDGNAQTEQLEVKTKGFIESVALRELYVVEKGDATDSGSGSEADPFRGLQVAADHAIPGDTFHIASGRYQSFIITVSGTAEAPIAWLGPQVGEAVIDGEGTGRGVVTLEADKPEDGIAYNVLEGLTIRNGNWGIDASYSHHIGIFNNNIVDVDYGFFNRRTTNLNHDQQVCGNTITGQTSYPSSDRLRKGIRIKGSNNLTCFNTITNFADGISTDEPGLDTRGSDIFGNDVSLCSDDGIEIDHDNSNMRVWQNRISNSKSAISTQPIIGGPAYILRNLIVNVDERTIKLHNNPSGLVIMHNTGFRSGTAFSDDAESTWPNSMVKNNIFWGSFYAFANLNREGAGTREIEYNAFGTSRDDGGNTYWIGAQKYPALSDVQATGLLLNNLPLQLSDFTATATVAEESIINLSDFDLRLKNTSALIDAGAIVDHVNKAYVFDGAPDMGAFEQGLPMPLYGHEGFESVQRL